MVPRAPRAGALGHASPLVGELTNAEAAELVPCIGTVMGGKAANLELARTLAREVAELRAQMAPGAGGVA